MSILTTSQNATYTALVEAEEQLRSDQNGVEIAHSLIDISKDVLALALDKQVRRILFPFSTCANTELVWQHC